MFELFVVLAVIAGLWLAVLVAGFAFKLLFGLIGGLFSVLGALLSVCVGGLVMLAVLPLLALALFPVWLPLLAVGFVLWLMLRRPREPAPAAAPH